MARTASTCCSTQRERDARPVGRVLEQAAQAFGRADHDRIAEGRGLALDVVRGSKQLAVGRLGDALA
jgi:hypothetical protein